MDLNLFSFVPFPFVFSKLAAAAGIQGALEAVLITVLILRRKKTININALNQSVGSNVTIPNFK